MVRDLPKDVSLEPYLLNPRLIPQLSVIRESSDEGSSDQEIKEQPQLLVFAHLTAGQSGFKRLNMPIQIDSGLVTPYFNQTEVQG